MRILTLSQSSAGTLAGRTGLVTPGLDPVVQSAARNAACRGGKSLESVLGRGAACAYAALLPPAWPGQAELRGGGAGARAARRGGGARARDRDRARHRRVGAHDGARAGVSRVSAHGACRM